MRQGVILVLLLLLLTAVAIPTTGQDDGWTRGPGEERLVITADYFGPTVRGEVPDVTKGGMVVYTVSDDGPAEVIWANSADALGEGETARYIGRLTQAEQDLLRQEHASLLAARCVVSADPPNYREHYNGMESSAWQSCIGD